MVKHATFHMTLLILQRMENPSPSILAQDAIKRTISRKIYLLHEPMKH
jgi:hypothetical protein